MKKFITIICILIITCSVFAGCSSNTTSTDQLLIQNYLTLYHVGDEVELLSDELKEELCSCSNISTIYHVSTNVYTDYLYSIQVTDNDVIVVFQKSYEMIYTDKNGNTYTEETLPDDFALNNHNYTCTMHYNFYEFSLLKHPDWIRPVKN